MQRSEFHEEIGQALTEVRLAGVLENIFEWNGAAEHGIVFIFTAALADETAVLVTRTGTNGPRRAATAIHLIPQGKLKEMHARLRHGRSPLPATGQ
jgi:ADP-ribose pyrophosphatase YjhB (NUDIX family)